MVTILPVKDSLKKAELLHTRPGVPADAELLLMADSAGEELGWAALELRDSIVWLLCVVAKGYDNFSDMQARFCADSLMRAASSYGAAYGAYRLECVQEDMEPILISAGFSKNGPLCGGLISNIVKISKESH